MKNPFTAHPHAVNETYWEHLGFALRFGLKMTWGGIAAIIHSLIPFLFVATAGKINDELQVMRQNSPGRKSYPDAFPFKFNRESEQIMKRTTPLTVLLSAMLLVGCGDKPTPAGGRVESPGEAMRNDDRAIAERLATQKAAIEADEQKAREVAERIQLADSLAAVSKRFSDAMDEGSRTPRAGIGELIKKMESIKAETGALATNECTEKARPKLLEGMTTGIDALTTFSRETGAPSEAAKQKQDLAGTQLQSADGDIARCR